MIRVYIDTGSGEVDYSRYVVDKTISIDQQSNQPTTINFTLSNFDTDFVMPPRSSYVRIAATEIGMNLITGFVTTEPQKKFIGPKNNDYLLAYEFLVTSDEWLLNVKQIPFIPAFVNQTMGQILSRLAEALVPGMFTFTNVADGDTIPYYRYDPKKMWSEVAKEFGDAIRYRYQVINKDISFQPFGDVGLGVEYDDGPTRSPAAWFDPSTLVTTLLATPVINDAVVIGDVEPRNIMDGNFIGDGFTTDFPLKKKVFRGASAMLMQEDWTGASFSRDMWDVVDPDGKFELAGTLNLLPGSIPATLGTEYILGNNGLELGGHLNIQAGELEFLNSFGTGIIGGVYSSTTLTLPNCLMGFLVSGGLILPVVEGVAQNSLSTIETGKHYLLQAVVNSNRWSRYTKVFRTLAGDSYGGDENTTTSDVTFLIQEIPVSDTTLPTVLQKSDLIPVTLPAFGLFAPVNSIDLDASMVFTQITQPPQGRLTVRSLTGPSGANLPTLPELLTQEQKYVLGFGLENQTATLQETQDVQQLRFYADSIPAAGARIKLRTWESGKAVGRVRDDASIATEGVIPGDDGVRSAIVADLNPLPRTSEECELAGKAFIADRTTTQFNGSYTTPIEYWSPEGEALQEENGDDLLDEQGHPLQLEGATDWPRPGRFFPVNSPMRAIDTREFFVRRVRMDIESQRLERVSFTIEFGPDLYTSRLLPKFLTNRDHILTPKDAATERPDPQDLTQIGLTFIDDLTDATATDITGTDVTIDLGAIPLTGAEVRRIDAGWGVDDSNRIALVTTQVFTVDRTAYDQTYYIRQVNGNKTSRYTTEVRVVYPLVPDAPIGTLDVRDKLKPEILLDITGDIRNICGIEVRSCMVTGAAVTGAPVTGDFASNIETPVELILGKGYKGEDKSVNGTIPLGSQNIDTTTLYTRSEFLFNHTYYQPGTQFYFEAVVTNSAYKDRPARNIYIQKQMRGRTNPNPVIVHTLAVPPGQFRRRIRFLTPFTGYQYDTLQPSVEGPSVTGATDYTDAYRVLMQAESQPVIAGYNPSTTIFPSADFVLHSLRLIAQSTAAQRACIDIPMVGTVEDHSFTDLTASVTSVAASGYVDFPENVYWLYNESEWSDIVGGEIHATFSSPAVTGQAYLGLYDRTAGSVIAAAIFDCATYPGQAACVRGTFTKYQLIDGHEYTVQVQVGGGCTLAYLYAGWLRIRVSPLIKANIYWRYANGPGSASILRTDEENGEAPYTGGFAVTAGCMNSRYMYDPAKNTNVERIFLEATMNEGGGDLAMVEAGVQDGPSIDLPGWFGYTSGNWIPAQNYTVDPNMAKFVNDLAAILGPDRVVDDYYTLSAGVIMSAWQFALFAAQLGGGGPAAGVNTINALRNSIFSGALDQIAALHSTESGWNSATKISFSSSTPDDWFNRGATWGAVLLGFNRIVCMDDNDARVYIGPGTATDGNNRFRYFAKATPQTLVTITTPASRPIMASIVALDDNLTVFLGTSSTGNNALIWKYRQDTGVFTTYTWPVGGGASDAFFIRKHPTNSDLLFIGNQSGSGNDIQLYLFTISTGTFTKIGGTGLNGSWNNSGSSRSVNVKNCAFDDTHIYVMITGGAANQDDVYRATLGSFTDWTRIGGAGTNGSWATGTKRNGGLAYIAGKLYAHIGGATAGDAEVWVCTNPASSPSWSQIGGDSIGGSWAGGTYLNASNAPIYPDDVILVVGLTGTVNGDSEVWTYNTTTGAWSQIGGDSIGGGWAPTSQRVDGLHISEENLLYASPSNNSVNSFSFWERNGLFGGAKSRQRKILFDDSLVQSNRYFGSPTANTVIGFMVFHIEAVVSVDIDVPDLLPIPPFGTVLMRRRFLAPSDLNWVFDNTPYRSRDICFLVYFFNLMWEYSEPLELSTYLDPPAIPIIQVISVLTIDIQVRLDLISTEDTVSVTVEMSASSLFVGDTIRVKGGPLQSVYSLHLPTGPNIPVVGQYIRAKRTDYLGDSDWSEIVFVSEADIKNQAYLSSLGLGTVVSDPINNLFTYVSDSTFITWSWPNFTLTYPDGFIQYINAGSYTSFTGLTPSTTYKFYPYLQGVRQALGTVVILLSQVTGGTAEDPDAASETKGDQRTPLSRSAMDGATTGGGGGSGSGGGVG